MLSVPALAPDDDLRSAGAESMFFVEFAAELEDRFGMFVPVEEIEACASACDIVDWIERQTS
jgi:acyl carrier protein